MPQSPPPNMPRISPNIFYEDLASALDWLSKGFGFETRMAMPGPDGAIMHAEMQVADSVIMMSPAADNDDWKTPDAIQGSVTMSLYVYVDDVNAHFATAQSAGVEIVSELEDMFWGDRTYVAKDLAGHRWTFAQVVKEIAPEDIKPPQ